MSGSDTTSMRSGISGRLQDIQTADTVSVKSGRSDTKSVTSSKSASSNAKSLKKPDAKSIKSVDIDNKSLLSVKADTRSVKSLKADTTKSTKLDTRSVKSLKVGDSKSVQSLQLDNKSVRSFHSADNRSVGSVVKDDVRSVHSNPEVGNGDLAADGFKRGRKTRRDKNLIAMISLGYRYVYKTQKLQVDVKRCWDIVPKGKSWQRVDPYVKIYLSPDKSKSGKRKSQILRNTFDPVFDKKLEYDIQKAELENRALDISLWHNNLFGHNVFLGELLINLDSQLTLVRPKTYELRKKPNPFGGDAESEEELSDEEPVAPVPIRAEDQIPDAEGEPSADYDSLGPLPEKTGDIVRRHSGKSMSSTKSVKSNKSTKTNKPRINPFMAAVAYCGDVLLGIKFVPENSVLVVYDRDLQSRGEVYVCIKKGMNLTGFGSKGETNAYCKMQLVHEGQIVLKHKTKIIKDNSNPEWNSCKRFENIGEEDLRDVDIEIAVLNRVGFRTKIIGKSKITIRACNYDWTRAKFLSDNTLYLAELVNQANQWIEFMAPLKPHDADDT